jgi:cytochrome c5
MRLNCISVCAIASAVFVCSSLPAADTQSTQMVVATTNASKFEAQSAAKLPNTIFIWDDVLKKKTVAPSEITAQFAFTFTNISPNTVTILSVRPSCSCTTAQLPPLPWKIAQGASGQIGVTVDLAGKSGTLFKTILVSTDKGSKLLWVKIVIPTTVPNAMTDAGRARNLAIAKVDRQRVFRNDCAICHAKPAIGKFGEKLYDVACGICHEGEDRATMVPDLHKINQPTNIELWRTWIEHGKPGTLMPAFSAAEGGSLTDNQIKSLANYLAKTIPSK